ncbi:hypothetical protein B0H13DRAFT_2296250 [Mycena leptocephala]|nr:hypothetical protein B0H13DRAFT_2296250 [Mycena leptocephala]
MDSMHGIQLFPTLAQLAPPKQGSDSNKGDGIRAPRESDAWHPDSTFEAPFDPTSASNAYGLGAVHVAASGPAATAPTTDSMRMRVSMLASVCVCPGAAYPTLPTVAWAGASEIRDRGGQMAPAVVDGARLPAAGARPAQDLQ